MRLISALVCLALAHTTFAATANDGFKLKYDGGSLAGVSAGENLNLFLKENQIVLMSKTSTILNVPPANITEISYGLDVHRRVGAAVGLAVVSLGVGALMALTKSKKHFIGLTWNDGGKEGGAAFQADKNEYRGVLAGLEGLTGKKAANSDAMSVKN